MFKLTQQLCVNQENTMKKKRNENKPKTPAKDRNNGDWLTKKIFEDLEKGFKISVTESLHPKR